MMVQETYPFYFLNVYRAMKWFADYSVGSNEFWTDCKSLLC
jgi:hypothetical protein